MLTLLILEFTLIPLLHRLRQGVEKDILGILVSYKIKINLMVAGGGWVSVPVQQCLGQINLNVKYVKESKLVTHLLFILAACWVASQQGERSSFLQSYLSQLAGSAGHLYDSDWLLCFLCSDVTVELPLMLMHPKPEGITANQTFALSLSILYLVFFLNECFPAEQMSPSKGCTSV